MRVLFLTTSYSPYVSGTATFAARQVSLLSSAGHVVGVVFPSPDGQARIISHEADRSESQVQYQLRSFANPFRQNHRTFLVTPAEVKQVIRDFHPDIIHYNDPLLWPWVIAPWARAKGIKLVLTQHALAEYVALYFPVLKLGLSLIYAWWRWTLSQFDLISVPSELMRRNVVETVGLRSVPVQVISNGVELSRFRTQFSMKPVAKNLKFGSNFRPNSRRKVIRLLVVSRLDPEKSVAVLLKALAQVSTQSTTMNHVANHDWQLRIAGVGFLESELRQLAKKLGIAKRVRFLGQVVGSTLVRQYHWADGFVIPAEAESQSIATLEAMASGLPIIAANSGALPELVKPGVNGWLFQAGSVADLARCLKEFSDIGSKFGVASLKLVQTHSLDQIGKIWLQTYQDLVR